MSRILRAFFFLAALAAMAQHAHAQQAPAHIGYAFPAGGKQGTSFQVVVGGQNLEGTADIFFSGPGIKANVVDYYKTLTPGQYQLLRDQMKLLLEKKASANGTGAAATQPAATRPSWTEADETKLADLRKKLSKPPKRIDNPALSETVTLDVTIDPKAATGDREIRLRTLTGLSNPLCFCVGQLPEFTAKDLARDAKTSPAAIALPAVVNGQIMPGAADQFRIKAKKGEHLVIVAAARTLIPYISDAVPGWFQAAVTLTDSKGRELAFADHFRFDPDPVIYYEVPADDEYTVEIRDAIYRGREDFVYRLTLGELPYITGIFPLGCKAGTKTTIELAGWNLPTTSVPFDATGKAPGVYPISITANGIPSNHAPFAVDSLPEITEQHPSETASTAQPVTLPVIINGRIDRPGESDFFKFEGHAGEELVAEVTARRLNSPLDSLLKLTDAAGKQIAFNDDHEDKSSALNTHYADSFLSVTLPASGTYTLQLADTQHKGGPDFAYRLRLSSPRPDFALRVTPSSLGLRAGSSMPLTVYALRKDGFTGEIAIDLKNAPAGFSLSGAKIPARQDQVTLTLKAANSGTEQPFNLTFEGRAVIAGQTILHTAVPAEDMMQAFIYHHLVPAGELLVTVSTKAMARNSARILSATPVKLTPGGAATIKTSMPTETFLGKIELELAQPTEGVIIKSNTAIREGSEFVLQSDAAKLKPGLKGNIIVNLFLVRETNADGGKPSAARRRISLGSLPAIPFEVAAP